MLLSFKVRSLLNLRHTGFVISLRIQSWCQNHVSVFVNVSEKAVSFLLLLLELKLYILEGLLLEE